MTCATGDGVVDRRAVEVVDLLVEVAVELEQLATILPTRPRADRRERA
jgi:hypothetical protein